jgi:hypothetical protein
MPKSVKEPRVFGIRRAAISFWTRDDLKGDHHYEVEIALSAMHSLPLWVRLQISWEDLLDSSNRCIVHMPARDELQALIRFKDLWAGLPKNK